MAMPWGVWKWEPEGEAVLRDLTSDVADARVRALRVVARWRNPDPLVRERVAALVSDPVREVRLAALDTVAEHGMKEARQAVLERLDSPDIEEAVAAVHALSRMGRDAAPVLEGLLQFEAGPVRCQAAVDLAGLLGEEAGPKLVPLLKDEDPFVRWGVAAALGDVGYGEARDELAVLLEDPDGEVRFEAAFSLARLGDDRGVVELSAHVTDRRKGYEVCEVLARFPVPEARRALRRAWKGWLVHPMVRVRAAASLACLGDSEARRDLWRRASGRRSGVAELALELVGEVGGPGAFELLRDALLAGRRAAAAARGLVRLGGSQAVRLLEEVAAATQDPELREELRQAAAEARRREGERS